MSGLPVLGVFTFEAIKKWNFEQQKKNRIIEELGLKNMQAPVTIKSPYSNKGDLLRIGMIGFGSRAQQLSNGLGFMHPAETEKKKRDESLNDWLEQEDLNVAISGICDVSDPHAEEGLATAQNNMQQAD